MNQDSFHEIREAEPRSFVANEAAARHMAFAEIPFRELAKSAFEENQTYDFKLNIARAEAELIKAQQLVDKIKEVKNGAENATSYAKSEYINLNIEKFKWFCKETIVNQIPLTPEQQVIADNAKKAIQEKFVIFNTERKFDIVQTYRDGKPIHTLFLSGDTGITPETNRELGYGRTWKNTMSPERDDEFTITINGMDYDTRKGMNRDVYEAFHVLSIAQGRQVLANSVETTHGNAELRNVTMLTGDVRDGEYRIPGIRMVRRMDNGKGGLGTSGVQDGGLRLNYIDGEGDGQGYMRFRPAVVIEDLTPKE
jgi:hypothetical protein